MSEPDDLWTKDEPPLPRALRSRVLRAVASEPAPTRAVWRRRGAAAALPGIGLLLGVFFLIGGVIMGERPVAHIVAIGVGWSILSATATWFGLRRGRSMTGPPSSVLALIPLLTPLVAIAWALASNEMWPKAKVLGAPPLIHFFCCDVTVLMGLGPVTAFVVARRFTDPVHPTLTGAALGAAGGAWGAVAIGLHCPASEIVHVAVGHVLPIVVLAGVGALLGRRFLGIRAPGAAPRKRGGRGA